jgi:hypothetical protein
MQTSLERLLGETPDYTFFKVFGCACWPHIRPYNNRKLQFRSKKCVFLGYSSLHKGYKYLHIPTNRTYISRDVVFDETVFPFSQNSSDTTLPSSSFSPLHSDPFVDVAYTPLLLANHGAGQGRGARLELLDEKSDRTMECNVDLHEDNCSHAAALGKGQPCTHSAQPCMSRPAQLPLLWSINPMITFLQQLSPHRLERLP